jgi:hypothetical protein
VNFIRAQPDKAAKDDRRDQLHVVLNAYMQDLFQLMRGVDFDFGLLVHFRWRNSLRRHFSTVRDCLENIARK